MPKGGWNVYDNRGATPLSRYNKRLGPIGDRNYNSNIWDYSCRKYFAVILNLIKNLIVQRFRNKFGMTEDCVCSEKPHVMLNLFQHLKNRRFRTKFEMTCYKICHPEHVLESGKKTIKKLAAFTLAEVLITLGIIGIVAALTIPTLVKKYQEKVMVTKVKQAHSQLINAIQLYVAKNNCTNMLCLFDTKKTSDEVAAELATVIKSAKICKETDAADKYCKYYALKGNTPTIVDGVYASGDGMTKAGRIYLPNGMIIRVMQRPQCVTYTDYPVRDENGYPTGETVTYVSHFCAYVYVDVNNLAGPNQFGVDVYRYNVWDTGKIEPYDKKLLNNALLYNKIEYTPFEIGATPNN